MATLIARSMWPTWGPRWAPCWPHELCYLARSVVSTVKTKPQSLMQHLSLIMHTIYTNEADFRDDTNSHQHDQSLASLVTFSIITCCHISYIVICNVCMIVLEINILLLHTEWQNTATSLCHFVLTLKLLSSDQSHILRNTVKPVYNDHLYNKIYSLWFIQECVSMRTEGTNLLLLTMSAFWSSSRWPLAT